MKLVQACLSAREDGESTVGVLSNSCWYVYVAGRLDKAILTTVEVM